MPAPIRASFFVPTRGRTMPAEPILLRVRAYTMDPARPQAEFQGLAATGIIVLLTALLSFNAVAVLIRHRMQKPLT